MPASARSIPTVACLGLALTFCFCGAAGAQTAPKPQSGAELPVPGHPVPADHARLSEHNIEWLVGQPPQTQMEFLLSSAVNHDVGATNLISKMVEEWRGKLTDTSRWQGLQET